MSTRQQGERLIEAIKAGKIKIVKELLQNGCDPNCRVDDVSKCTPAIIIAVVNKRFDCLKALLEHGAAVDSRDKDGMTAAMYASDIGLHHYLHTLADHKADLNAVNEQGASLLMLAAKWDNFDCLHYLIDSDPPPDINRRDKHGRTALMYAAMHGRIDCLNLLIDSKADLNITDSVKGFTALMYALEQRESACANCLLDKEANVNVVVAGKAGDITALNLAFHSSKEGNGDSMIERLLRSGADLALSRLDQQFLHEMVAGGKKRIVRLMVINGCPPFDRVCREPCTFKFSEYRNPISPLCVALLSGHYDIAKYFIVNRFFTNYDMTVLPNDLGIRAKVQGKEDGGAEALAVLNLICSAPQTLNVLSFVTISDTVYKTSNVTERRDKIQRSDLPAPLQSRLLFTTKGCKICILSWHELSLIEDLEIQECTSCSECRGEGFRVKKR
ncbi:unnamed protein product [Candidula unifasciata]|uniref:Ankyrin repeat protein n=1 Tax=Candidula unifasciata TaxID=100452 RepID=A0A8S4A1X9_9EUPU|nr:unnamed protein product [Candidula unifasciata]